MAVTRIHILNMILLTAGGLVILLLSLLTANNLQMSGGPTTGEQWKLYFGRDILPDNILYPLLMIRDRARLDSLSPDQQVALKLEYAQERYKTSEALAQQKQILLAISTLTKSQKYVISAGYQALELGFNKDQLQHVRNAVQDSTNRLDTFSKDHPSYDLSIIIQLKEETRVLMLQLDEKLAKL
jgi:hypothetical protein